MDFDLAFLARDVPFSGKEVSTKALAYGLSQLGWSVTISSGESMPKSKYYAATCVEDADLLPERKKARCILWLRGRPTAPGPIDKNAIKRAGHYFATSQWLAQRQSSNASGQIKVLPETFIWPELEGIARPVRAGLLFVGRASRQKGLQTLLRALQFLPPSLNLTVVGPAEDQVIKLAEGLGLSDRVTWVGLVPPEDVGQYYLQAKFCVITAQREPFGLPLVEALAWGCTPIAIQGSPGPEEILGKSPLLIDSSPHGLAHDLLNRQSLSFDQAREMARPYEAVTVAQQFLRAIGE